MAGTDFYAVLGVPKSSSQKELRQAYRKLARQLHPDVNPGDKAAEAQFKEINAAYEVLSDADKRKKYDRYGEQWQHADQIEEQQRQSGGGRTFRFRQGDGAQSVEFGDLGDVFSSFFGGRQRGPRKGASLEQPVDITLEEAFHGGSRTLQLAVEELCSTCGGQGEIAGATCHTCQGAGVVMKPKRLEVKIPPGVDNGSRIRIAGEGGAGTNGGSKGDLYLSISVRPHERFERKGDDLYVDVDVPVADLVLGAEVEIPTLTGKVLLNVPPLTQNGNMFRLAGQGMPRLKGGGRGNFFVRVRANLPKKLDDKEKKLFEELRTAGV